MSTVEVISLGGVGEIGKNCTVVRQGDDIVVLDCGLSFPNEEMPGVDIVIPDFTYLIENAAHVRGVFLTHAHEDHVGALPYLLQHIDVPIHASEFTLALMKPKLDEQLPKRKLDLRPFQFGDILEAGALSVEPIRVTHSIPENASFAVRTVHGIVLLTGDFKFDFTPVDGKLSNVTRFGELAKEGVVLLLSDSTNVDRKGWGPSEKIVADGLRKVFLESPGRVLLTTFASTIHRMQQVYEVAAQTNRKVAVVGRRMEQNVETCSRLGYMKIPPGTRISLEETKNYPNEQLAILTTGSQGEPLSALVQMSKGTYGRLQIQQGDTVIYSARPIPGNEAAIWRTINRLFRQGARVVYGDDPPVHVSGHAYEEELKLMLNLTRPYYFAPVHGERRHQYDLARLAFQMDYPEHRVFLLDIGERLVVEETDARIEDRVPCGRVLVDNSGTPGVTDDVLRDRSNLSREGVIAVTVAIDVEMGEVVGDPYVQVRGVHSSEDVGKMVAKALDDLLDSLNVDDLRDSDKVRHLLAEAARRVVQRSIQMRPLVLPTVVEV
ncbi:MAG: ribonuclease J [Fimbriimonadaceae bacterium]|uniref:Ribonuclease J n=1 Tax=Candidatus Nitrosymbiomonas proteolyticus TaxID=2608984 RepID=A0A809R576_9BACT|nr:ribonuclease J [Fimbriimonadaceae bacterium]NUM37547.1 ribonuclease J [Armatimonadota bacterium]BBO22720.1 mRNA degradation ribonuclease J1/J2 [Candidatus Nitrosymbiomonas proteolyticus]